MLANAVPVSCFFAFNAHCCAVVLPLPPLLLPPLPPSSGLLDEVTFVQHSLPNHGALVLLPHRSSW